MGAEPGPQQGEEPVDGDLANDGKTPEDRLPKDDRRISKAVYRIGTAAPVSSFDQDWRPPMNSGEDLRQLLPTLLEGPAIEGGTADERWERVIRSFGALADASAALGIVKAPLKLRSALRGATRYAAKLEAWKFHSKPGSFQERTYEKYKKRVAAAKKKSPEKYNKGASGFLSRVTQFAHTGVVAPGKDTANVRQVGREYWARITRQVAALQEFAHLSRTLRDIAPYPHLDTTFDPIMAGIAASLARSREDPRLPKIIERFDNQEKEADVVERVRALKWDRRTRSGSPTREGRAVAVGVGAGRHSYRAMGCWNSTTFPDESSTSHS